MKVRCNVKDGTIWQIENFIINVMESAVKHRRIEVDLHGEGVCCRDSGLEEILDKIVEVTSLDPSQVVIHKVGNLLDSTHYLQQHKSYWELHTAGIPEKFVSPFTSLEKIFAIFVGRSNWQRLALASYIWNNYQDKSLISFHYDRSSDYHNSNFDLEILIQKHWEDRDNFYKFLEVLPLKIEENYVYPITLSSEINAWSLLDYYENVFCDVVCETYFSGQTFYPTEKIVRPMISKRPFIVQGPTNYLKNLKRMGFKTFSDWWDEGYDEDPPESRYNTLKWNIDYIGQQSESTLLSWHAEMLPILEHNRQRITELNNEKVMSIFHPS
jgi:hypothetical protein